MTQVYLVATASTVTWSQISDLTVWMKKPRVHPYYLRTAPWWLVCTHQKPVDRNLVLYRLGKALGYIQ